jgi:hypothetical protein
VLKTILAERFLGDAGEREPVEPTPFPQPATVRALA